MLGLVTLALALGQQADAARWLDWGPDALAAARSRDRPILVVIGSSACHPCQALDRAVSSDRGLADAIDAAFVAVRVDRDARPEVEEALRASAGLPPGDDGEPLVLLVNADGRPGTRAAYGGAADDRAALRRWLSGARESARFDARAHLPPFGALRLHLAEAAAGDLGSRRRAAELLEAIARGGIRDHVGGGFHHAARDGGWAVPRFEKLLSDNALLVRAYAQAFALSRDLFFRDVVKETVAWAIREMRDPTGAFLASVSATTEGGEGRFYLWTRDEILATLGPERGPEFLAVYRLEPPGVLQLIGSPFAGLGASRDVLQVRRNRRVRPSVDDKVLAGWNGLMIGALATSGSLIHRGSDLEAARRAAGSVLERLGPARSLRRYAVGQTAAGSAVLEDYAYLAEGLLALHEATGEARWRQEALALADAAVARFWDIGAGGFFATDARHDPLPLRLKTARDGPRPSANAVMAAVLLRLGRLGGQPRYAELGRKTIEAFEGDARADTPGFEALAAARLGVTPPPPR